MSLQAPDLDDRKFQDIVNEAKRLIGLRCPEWTDHNVSDPGVTLIELFAWMTELTLYRLNQVPERNYIKYLEMLGISLEPPVPAQTELRFRLSRPIEDADGEERKEETLRAGEIVAATVRTEYTDAIEFTTDASLRLVRPKLAHVLAIPAPRYGAGGGNEFGTTLPDEARWYRQDGRDVVRPDGERNFPIFSGVPVQDDALWLGFENDVAGNLVELSFRCVRTAAVGLGEDNPAQVWEWWNTAHNRWDAIERSAPDTTRGFNVTGRVELAIPRALTPARIGDRKACWIRCRYTLRPEELPLRPGRSGGEMAEPLPPPTRYQASPVIVTVDARTQGGTAPASNSVTITSEELGVSDGAPGQVFVARNKPILPRKAGESIRIGPQEVSLDEMDRWEEVVDFAESEPDDRHFTCDSLSGEIRFGPSIQRPDGTMQQHGAIPGKGLTVMLSAYRCGGGTQGNVQEGQVRVLKSTFPYISDVENPQRATGGLDRESLAHAKLRAQAMLRIRDRAVTGEDFEYLAMRTTGVGRAQCLAPERGDAGRVKLRLIPSLGAGVTVPLPSQLRLPPHVLQAAHANLDERRLLTTILDIEEPDYVFVSTDITLVAAAEADPDLVRRRVQEKLEAFVHPLTGGPTKDGWPFGRTLTIADLYSQIQLAQGVAFLLGAPQLHVSHIINRDEGIFSREEDAPIEEGIRIEPHQVLCTRMHRIQVRPMNRTALV